MPRHRDQHSRVPTVERYFRGGYFRGGDLRAMRPFLSLQTGLVLYLLVASGMLLLQLSHIKYWDITRLWASSSAGHNGGGRESGRDQARAREAALSYSVLHEVVNASRLDLSRGEVRFLKPHGLASHFFIQLSSYRLGARRFATVGLVAQRFEELHERVFECEWVSEDEHSTVTIKGKARKIRPDFSYHRLYGTLVISCTFDEDIDDSGGSFWISANYGDTFRPVERFAALTEMPRDYNSSAFAPPFPYEYVYCGSPLWGNLSPQRIREWMTFHNHLFGERTYFVLYDAGGIHDEAYEALRPWVELGRVNIQNVREAEVYDGYYHHQFTVVNDCMMRAQTLANWTFFFDMDEYLYVNTSFGTLAQQLEWANASQIQLQPVKLDSGMCLQYNSDGLENHTHDDVNTEKWMMEKLVFAWKYRALELRDKKYAIQSRSCWATGVHKCELLMEGGRTHVMNEEHFRFYHYHNTLSTRVELCKEFIREHNLVRGNDRYYIDNTIAEMVKAMKQYERQTIGEQSFVL